MTTLQTQTAALGVGVIIFVLLTTCIYKCSKRREPPEEPEDKETELRIAEEALTIDEDSETDEEFFSDEEY